MDKKRSVAVATGNQHFALILILVLVSLPPLSFYLYNPQVALSNNTLAHSLGLLFAVSYYFTNLIAMTSLRILAFTTLATFLAVFTTQPALALTNPGSNALSFGKQHLHARLAKKQFNRRSTSKKCRARPSSTTHHDNTHTQSPSPSPTQSHPSGSGPSGLDFFKSGSKLGLAWPDGNAGYLKNLKGIKM